MNKMAAFLYGIVSYIVFFLTFLYAIGFLTEFIVPKTINSGDASGLLSSLIINAILLSLFAIQHTVMARPAFKRWWSNYVPVEIERSTYVLLSSLLLCLIFWQWQPMTTTVWQLETSIALTIVWAICALGWLTVLVSTFLINHFDLFGLRQVWLHLKSRPYEHIAFQTNGLYKLVRHPIMLGFVIAFWATPHMTTGHLLFAVATTLYILIGIQFEEHDLLELLGDDYKQYKQSVSMLIPKL